MQEPSVKTNKGIILSKSVDYLKILQNAGTQLQYRNDQLINALKSVMAESGIPESRLGLSFSLDSRIEFPLPNRENVTPSPHAMTSRSVPSMMPSTTYNTDPRLSHPQTTLAVDLLNSFESNDSLPQRLGTQMHEFDQMMN
jgi:hypothetical protein